VRDVYFERNMGARYNLYFGRHFDSLECFAYNLLLLLLAPNNSCAFCLRLKLERHVIHKLNIMSDLFTSVYSVGVGGGGRSS
jgi:hypothetical protein